MTPSSFLTKKLLRSVCAAAALLAASAQAAPVVFGTPTTISADTDVATTGTLERALNFGQSNAPAVASTTINGVTFDPFAVASGNGTTTVSLGNTSLTSTGGGFLRGSNGFGAGTGISAAYGSLLDQAFFTSSNNSNVTLTLSGLTIGNSYLVQFFVQDSRSFGAGATVTVNSGGNSATLDYNNTEAAGGRGQFVTGTFTADAATQAFTFVPTSNAIINGFQLRTTAVIPEPSSLALIGVAGAAALAVKRLRRVRR